MKGLRPFSLHYNPNYCVTWANKLNTAINWEEGVCDSYYPEVELVSSGPHVLNTVTVTCLLSNTAGPLNFIYMGSF